MSKLKEEYYLKSVANALEILSIVAKKKNARLSEIVSEVPVSKAAVFRMLYTMTKKGFVDKNETTGEYRLGYRVFALGTRVIGYDLLRNQLTPFLEELSRLTGETANVGILDGMEVIHANSVLSTQALRLDIKIGDREPAYSTALGKVLLAHTDWDEIKTQLSTAQLKPFTPNTITNLSELRTELEKTRQQGYAIDNEETYSGIRCIAIPIRDVNNLVFAGLSISAPKSRFPMEKVPDYRAYLQRTGDDIHSFINENMIG